MGECEDNRHSSKIKSTVFGQNAVPSENILSFNSFFSVRRFVGSVWSFGFFIPATTANDLRLRRIFYPRVYPLYLFSYINSWERASIFPFECSVLNIDTIL